MKRFLRPINSLALLSLTLCLGSSHAAQLEPRDDCDDVIAIVAKIKDPDQALSRLGACLATPAPLPVLQRVALQMAIVSFQKGDPAWGMRYLDILVQMLEDNPTEPVAVK